MEQPAVFLLLRPAGAWRPGSLHSLLGELCLGNLTAWLHPVRSSLPCQPGQPQCCAELLEAESALRLRRQSAAAPGVTCSHQPSRAGPATHIKTSEQDQAKEPSESF